MIRGILLAAMIVVGLVPNAFGQLLPRNRVSKTTYTQTQRCYGPECQLQSTYTWQTPAVTTVRVVPTAPATVQASATATAAATQASQRIEFRRELMAAAREARAAGDITIAEYFKLAVATRSPALCDNLMAAAHEAAIEEGLATTQAIDWEGLADFLERLVPIIIQLIELFT